jgi:protein-disulfide isomerase
LTNHALLLVFLGSSACLLGGSPETLADQDRSAVIAQVDGTKFTFADFEAKQPQALFQAKNTFYDAEKKAVDEFVDNYLLERQAQKEHVSVAELLQKHVNSTVAKDPDDAALRVYFEGIDTTEPFEVVRVKILEHLQQRRLAKAKTAYMQTLRGQATIAVTVAPPRAQVSLDHTPVRGPANAVLTLVEYADYECPYCQQMQPDLNKLEAEYKGKLAFAYKDVPLPMHTHAQKAAEATHCAGVQNKYWEYHDLLLNTKALELPQLKAGARELALDTTAFDKCLDSGEQASQVKTTLDEAQKFGLQGTPSFFLNGRFLSGIMTYDQLRNVIEEELKISSARQETAKR